jgi:hypothetical protein
MNKTSQAASLMGKVGGKKSAEKRLGHLSKEQASELMRKVRMTPKERVQFESGLQGMVDNLNKNSSEE